MFWHLFCLLFQLGKLIFSFPKTCPVAGNLLAAFCSVQRGKRCVIYRRASWDFSVVYKMTHGNFGYFQGLQRNAKKQTSRKTNSIKINREVVLNPVFGLRSWDLIVWAFETETFQLDQFSVSLLVIVNSYIALITSLAGSRGNVLYVHVWLCGKSDDVMCHKGFISMSVGWMVYLQMTNNHWVMRAIQKECR